MKTSLYVVSRDFAAPTPCRPFCITNIPRGLNARSLLSCFQWPAINSRSVRAPSVGLSLPQETGITSHSVSVTVSYS